VRLSALVVGLGQVGMGYDLSLPPDKYVLTHCRAFQQHAEYELIAGVDPDPERRRLFESHYDRPAYTDIGTAAASQQPAIVAVSVPTHTHCATVHSVLGAMAPAAILCEKPLSYSIHDARSIADVCSASACMLFANYIRRSEPGVLEIRRRFDSGGIQGPVKGVAWYSKGLFNNGSHFFNLLQYWLGEVQSWRIVDKGRVWGESDPEPDFVVTFAGGIVHFLAAREECFSHYTVELLAPNGRLRYEQGGARISWQGTMGDASCAGYTVLDPAEEIVAADLDRIQWHVADQIAMSLCGHPAQVCSGAEALRTLEQLEEIRAGL
jgi:predicted dehydrogenase